MYKQKNLDTEMLLKWSKLLEYDFLRIYSQHLILCLLQKRKNKFKYKTKLPNVLNIR